MRLGDLPCEQLQDQEPGSKPGNPRLYGRNQRLLVLFLLLLTGFASPSTPAHAADKCVNVYHDERSETAEAHGPVNAIFLANLLGHWPQFEVRVAPIEGYQAGNAENCAQRSILAQIRIPTSRMPFSGTTLPPKRKSPGSDSARRSWIRPSSNAPSVTGPLVNSTLTTPAPSSPGSTSM